MTVQDILDDILQREGGIEDDALDLGGLTNWGITLPVLADWRQRDVTEEDLRHLSKDEARRIYQKRYMEDPGFLQLPCPIIPVMVDFAVNSGVRRAIQELQRVVGTTQDGVLGPKTLAAVRLLDPKVVRQEVVKARVLFLGRCVAGSPAQSKFLVGWLHRALDFLI